MNQRKEFDEMLDNAEIRHFFDHPLSRLTTLRIGGPCDLLVKVENIDALKVTVEMCRMMEKPFFVIGAGSNILASDDGFRGIVIKLAGEFLSMKTIGWRMVVGAGQMLPKLAQRAKSDGLSGLEFLAGIPGTVGGAIYMNAGAFGSHVFDRISKVTVFDVDTLMVRDDFPPFKSGYRKSPYQDRKSVIMAVEFGLVAEKSEIIDMKMKDYECQRKNNQPWKSPSAGSVFMNPEGHKAYELISKAGFSGASVGGAKVSEKHANFIINENHASARDVLSLVRKIKDKVHGEFGVVLDEEIELMGDFQ